MQLHELTGLFPRMSEDEFLALKNDIHVNGQHEPIWLCDGKVIDGKHRLRACEELGIEPAHREYKGSDPIAFVVSMNLHRRHLDHGQRAMLGDRIRDAYERNAKERQKEAGRTYGRGKVVQNSPHPLRRQWNGRVWLNPPYSQPEIRLFAEKAVAEVRLGHVTECIVLTHNYTDTAWFHTLGTEASAICFTRGRIGFLSPDGRKAAPTQGQAFFYFGNQADRFAKVFSQHGLIVRPE